LSVSCIQRLPVTTSLHTAHRLRTGTTARRMHTLHVTPASHHSPHSHSSPHLHLTAVRHEPHANQTTKPHHRPATPHRSDVSSRAVHTRIHRTGGPRPALCPPLSNGAAPRGGRGGLQRGGALRLLLSLQTQTTSVLRHRAPPHSTGAFRDRLRGVAHPNRYADAPTAGPAGDAMTRCRAASPSSSSSAVVARLQPACQASKPTRGGGPAPCRAACGHVWEPHPSDRWRRPLSAS